jgi:hypothetical protein
MLMSSFRTKAYLVRRYTTLLMIFGILGSRTLGIGPWALGIGHWAFGVWDVIGACFVNELGLDI